MFHRSVQMNLINVCLNELQNKLMIRDIGEKITYLWVHICAMKILFLKYLYIHLIYENKLSNIGTQHWILQKTPLSARKLTLEKKHKNWKNKLNNSISKG